MARLDRLEGPAAHLLRAYTTIGRAPQCTLCLSEPAVSAMHASLVWSGAAWVLQDLGSRNGTWFAGRRLAAGERVAVTRGAHLGFGRPQGWLFADDAPPEAFALPRPEGPPVVAVAGILALPSADLPSATVFHDPPHGWGMELRGDVQRVADGQVVGVGERMFELVLPDAVPATWEDDSGEPSIDSITLRFAVSQDEEHVELVAQDGGRGFDLERRVHHYVLLVLARRRLADAACPGLAACDHGWIHQERLLEMLRIDPNRLHIDIYRARRQLAEAGVTAATRLVERRANTGMLRIGVARLEIRPLPR